VELLERRVTGSLATRVPNVLANGAEMANVGRSRLEASPLECRSAAGLSARGPAVKANEDWQWTLLSADARIRSRRAWHGGEAIERQMDAANETWHYYGVWRSPSAMLQEQRPLTGIVMAGWVRARGTAWGVAAGQVEVDLIVSRPEMDFLSECCARQFVCWASGIVVMTKHTKMMVPDDIAVYHVSAGAGACPTPLLGRMLAENGRTWALRQTWADIISKESFRTRRVVHPLAMLQHPTEPLDDVPETSIGYVFASHVQAEVTSGTSKFFGSSAARLGNSGYVYDHATERCEEAGNGARGEVAVAKGGIIVADTARSLMLLTNGCCHMSDETSRCLVVASREALPPLLSALADMSPVVACCERELAPLQLAPRLLVATAETARKSKLIGQTFWTRVVVCDWTRVFRVLASAQPETSTFLQCESQIALIMADSLDGPHDLWQAVSETGLALLLGVPARQLGCPSAIKELVCERTLRVEDSSAQDRARVRRYGVLRLAAPNDEEKEDAHHHEGYEAALAALLGPLRTAGRSAIAQLPRAMTLEEFFASRPGGAPVSDFASASFRTRVRGCAICMTESGATAVTRCGHWFCTRCIARALALGSQQCPVCRAPLPNPLHAAVQVGRIEGTTYLAALARLLREQEDAGRRLVVCSFASCLERVSSFLRGNGVRAVAWSGNARQLIRNLRSFASSSDGVLLCDPEFLPIQLLKELSDVQHILCLLPMNTERREVCCQLRSILISARRARLSFVCCRDASRLPSERPDCGRTCGDCPFLVQSAE
jgi:hypothetical protein